MTNIYLPISKLGTYTGLSPYGNLSESIISLWKKIDLNGYSNTLDKLQKKYNKEINVYTEWQEMENISQQLGLYDMKDKIKESMKAESQSDLKRNQRNLIRNITQISSDNKVIEEKKDRLKVLVNSFTNRGFGTKHENNAIDLYVNQTNNLVEDQQKTITKMVCKSKSPEVNWFLIGKIDGISIDKDGNKKILEIKNRTNKLFKVLKDYEKPQIQAYMKLIDLEKGQLVECLKQKKDSSYSRDGQICIIDVEFDNDYWEQLKDRISKFVLFMIEFLKNEKIQEFVLMGGDDNQLKSLLESYLVQP